MHGLIHRTTGETMIYSIVLSNGKIIDGCGNTWFWGDLAIQDGHIAQIALPGSLKGKRTFDIQGNFVAPGFIDIHTHSDLTILLYPQAESAVHQGVTTHLVGNCGMSLAPVTDAHLDDMKTYWDANFNTMQLSWEWRSFDSYLNAIVESGTAINIGALIGHGAVRLAVMGFEECAPSQVELEHMQTLTREGMQAGAFGLSTGLVYPPGCFATTQEIVALAKVAAEFGGFYASHIRGERETILEAVAEAINIGREAGLPVQISHNCPKFGAPCDANGNLALVEAARAEGLDVTVDNDVHTDLGPALVAGLPQEIQSRPIHEIRAMLSDPVRRAAIKTEIIHDQQPAFGPTGLLKHGQWQRIILLNAPHSPDVIGLSLQAIGEKRGCEPFEAYFDLIIENGGDAEAIFDYIDEENIRLLLRHPAMMICSDGCVEAPCGVLNSPPSYSPCSYGEFPGILERYVREKPVLTLEDAIRKMTSFPAQRMGLWDRGVLRPGACADIVVFDLEKLHDRATNLYPHTYPFENFPHQYPTGIEYVFVNGSPVIENGKHTGALSGQVLRQNPNR
jgi:N-acyl-D-amino-acid deacylase